MNRDLLRIQELEIQVKIRQIDHKMLEIDYVQPNGVTLPELVSQKQGLLKELGAVRLALYRKVANA